jgi:prepilin-type N-terminal cleavage/methylation domain-containing protein
MKTPGQRLLTSDQRTTLNVRRSAFTLIEMLIVISIISVLLGLLYGAIERAQKFSRRTIAFTELKSIDAAFKQYYAYYHMWPSNGLASTQLTSVGDTGFVIDEKIAQLLQGYLVNKNDLDAIRFNPEAIPFIEFSRFDPILKAPVNPFKPNSGYGQDTMRQFKVLFDTDGDRQIMVTDSEVQPAWSGTNIIASVAVWTIIPATRESDATGQTKNTGDVVFGSWDLFSVK